MHIKDSECTLEQSKIWKIARNQGDPSLNYRLGIRLCSQPCRRKQFISEQMPQVDIEVTEIGTQLGSRCFPVAHGK